MRHFDKCIVSTVTATAAAAATLAPQVAYSRVYMQEEDVFQELFGNEARTRQRVSLSDAQMQGIRETSGERVRHREITLWLGQHKNVVLIDQVLGKHEMITYGVGIEAASGQVRGVDILEYRESYGHQVKTPGWRQQFVGKTLQSPLKLEDDIVNISGATLSSSHVTQGVRRLLHTYAAIKNGL